MIGIVDYGVSNLDSVSRAVTECGGEPMIASSPSDLGEVSAIILPGVGSFAHGMASLRARGLDVALAAEVLGNRIPCLGICLGMQLLADRGFENGSPATAGRTDAIAGLGWIAGEVRRLPPTMRIPHVGWNEVYPQHDNPAADDMFRGLEAGRDFYFVHSYRFVPDQPLSQAATTPYAGGFCSAVAREHVWGVQFHPEKSQRVGFAVLRNFIEAAC